MPLGSPQAMACWRPDPPMHPQFPFPFRSSSILGKSCFLPPGHRPWGLSTSQDCLTSPLPTMFPRSSLLYESTLVVEGVLSEKPCTLRLRGRGSYDERYVIPHQF